MKGKLKMSLFEKITDLEKSNSSFVIVTVVELSGSVPGKIGFKMIVESNGNATGTVGGGAIEIEAVKDALARLLSGESGIKEYLLSDKQNKIIENTQIVPMKCSGKVTLYFEVHGNLPAIYIFGGGHVGQALLQFLSQLSYFTVLIDNRNEIIESKHLPSSRNILTDYVEFADSFNPKPDDFIVVLTQGHKYDFDIVRTIFKRKLNVSYVGVIASKNKARELEENLKNEFGSDIDLSKLHSPIGLKLGGNTASEIALCIAAEIQQIRFSKG
jgi:xanthine dehydrogenase accessory factor